MGLELVPLIANRPAWVRCDLGCCWISVATHDAYYLRTRRTHLAAIRRLRRRGNGDARVGREAIEKLRVWERHEAAWYRALRLAAPGGRAVEPAARRLLGQHGIRREVWARVRAQKEVA